MVLKENPRIVLAGSVYSTRRTLQALLRHRMNLVGVLGLSAQKAAHVSGYTRLDDLLENTGIPYADFENINENRVAEQLKIWQPDLFFVVGLSQLVKPDLMALPRIGCVGFHPTRLPEGRGRAPIAWLILEQRQGAATFFLMNEAADAGPILVQEPFEVTREDDAGSVIDKMEKALEKALDTWLPQLRAGHWNPQPQDASRATLYGRRAPEDGYIDWTRNADEIVRLIRASSRPHPGAYTYVNDAKLIIWKAEPEPHLPVKGVVGRVLDITPRGVLVQTGQGLIWLTEWTFADPSQAPAIQVGTSLMLKTDDEIVRLKKRLQQLETTLENLLAHIPNLSK